MLSTGSWRQHVDASGARELGDKVTPTEIAEWLGRIDDDVEWYQDSTRLEIYHMLLSTLAAIALLRITIIKEEAGE